MKRLGLGLLMLMLAASLGAEEPAAPEPSGALGEAYWRNSFRSLHAAFDAIVACRETLSDYCLWERIKSREPAEVEAYQEYLDAKRRGEDARDPLAGKVYVPEACEKLFETHPEPVRPRTADDASDSCLTRTRALIAEIDRVNGYWSRRREELERLARDHAVPRSWRQRRNAGLAGR